MTHRLSSSFTIWATIALVHFYLYVRSDIKAAKRVITWAAKQREIPSSSGSSNIEKEEDGEEEDGEEDEDEDEKEEGNGKRTDV
jgi:hypothetical protein